MERTKTLEFEEYCKYCKRKGLNLTIGACGECTNEKMKYTEQGLWLPEYKPNSRRRRWPRIIFYDGQKWRHYNTLKTESLHDIQSIIKSTILPVVCFDVFRSERPLLGRSRTRIEKKVHTEELENKYAMYVILKEIAY